MIAATVIEQRNRRSDRHQSAHCKRERHARGSLYALGA